MTIVSRRDYDKGRKYHDVDDKPWSYDSRRQRSEKNERKERHWMQTRLERSPGRPEIKSVVERKVRKLPKSSKEENARERDTKQLQRQRDSKIYKDQKSEQKEIRSSSQTLKSSVSKSSDGKPTQKSREVVKEPIKKGIMSDSMRELVFQSIKESKGLAQEVVEEESDDSPEHFFQV